LTHQSFNQHIKINKIPKFNQNDHYNSKIAMDKRREIQLETQSAEFSETQSLMFPEIIRESFYRHG